MMLKSRVFSETLILFGIGATFALLANQLSPRGLSLTRDYFARPKIAATLPVTSVATPARSENLAVAGDDLRQRLAEKGLTLIESAEVEVLFNDPLYQQESIVFIDARDDNHFAEGHIPGAFQFDRYYPQNYLPTVLPACMNATRIVVYCTGGKCEDSEFAAITLTEAGIPAASIAVYTGGIADWISHKRPIETGARNSGILQTPAQ